MGFPFGRGLVPRFFEKFCKAEHYPQFNWFVIWTVTTWCNLNCEYCYVGDRTDKRADLLKAAREIARVKPRFLGLHGGEPVLREELPQALSEIRQACPKTLILTETNATSPQKVITCLSWLNHIEISLDGLGDINRQVRGVDGDRILANFLEIRQQALQTKTTLSISTVLTTVNYKAFPDLVEVVQGKAPGTAFAVFVMHPKDRPLSVCHDAETWRKCREMLRTVTAAYPQVRYKGDVTVRSSCRCGAQYFIRHINPMGEWYDCKPNMHLDIFRRRTAHVRGWGGQWQILKEGLHLLDVLMLRKSRGMTCHEPCDWGEPLNPLFGFEKNLQESLVKMIGSLDEREKDELFVFVRKNINPGITREWMDHVLEP